MKYAELRQKAEAAQRLASRLRDEIEDMKRVSIALLGPASRGDVAKFAVSQRVDRYHMHVHGQTEAFVEYLRVNCIKQLARGVADAGFLLRVPDRVEADGNTVVAYEMRVVKP